MGVLGFVVTARVSRPLFPTAANGLLQPRTHPGLRVMDIGWPMLAQLLSPPIAVSSQRLVLAQWGTHEQVAEYGVAGQVFFALQGLVLAAGVALWPLYARRRAQGTLQRGPALQSAIFGSAVVLATLFVWLIGPWLFGFITDGELTISAPTILSFGLMITCIAVAYPLGMFIMDKPGLRFQVIPTLLMAFSSLGLAIVLTPLWGTPGPLLANVIAMTVCQIIPFAIYIRLNRHRLLSPSSNAEEPIAAELQEGAPDR